MFKGVALLVGFSVCVCNGVFEPGTFVEVEGNSFAVVVEDGVARERLEVGDVTVEAVVLSVRIACVV